jgi:hypothetical protein
LIKNIRIAKETVRELRNLINFTSFCGSGFGTIPNRPSCIHSAENGAANEWRKVSRTEWGEQQFDNNLRLPRFIPEGISADKFRI